VLSRFHFLEFLLFGEKAKDTVGPNGDDSTSDAVALSVPVVYFGEEQSAFYVRKRPIYSVGPPIYSEFPIRSVEPQICSVEPPNVFRTSFFYVPAILS